MAVDTKELDALSSALNRSAERLQTLWLSFLALSVYLSISAFTTTHEMLLLGEGQKLPFFDVKLPLTPFYVVAPVFYVVFHAYFLMMLVLLARTAGAFEDALAAAPGLTGNDRERYRMRLENTIFLQIVAGAERERSGTNGIVLRAIAIISVAVAPVLVLLLFQLMFLAYHSVSITWIHRALIVIDLGLIWTLWSSYRRQRGERFLPGLNPIAGTLARGAATVLVVLFSVLVARFPSEPLYDELWGAGLSSDLRSVVFGTYDKELFFNTRGWFPDRVWAPGAPLVDEKHLGWLDKNEVAGRARRIPRIDLSGRDLTRANLSEADLRRANFSGPSTTLREADLRGALLDDALFRSANLHGARLDGAYMKNTSLTGVNLTRATLSRADLQGAYLAAATLSGANLDFARFDGAVLLGSRLIGVRGEHAQFNFAVADRADFRGSSLTGARFVGAVLSSADFRGADMTKGQFQGATLGDTDLRSATFSHSKVWRTAGKPRLDNSTIGVDLSDDPLFLTHDAFAEWHELQLRVVAQASTIRTFPVLLDPDKQSMAEKGEASFIGAVLGNVASEMAVQNALEGLVCDANGAPFVALALLNSGRLKSLRPEQKRRLRAVFDQARTARAATPADCPGAPRLEQADWEYLQSSWSE